MWNLFFDEIICNVVLKQQWIRFFWPENLILYSPAVAPDTSHRLWRAVLLQPLALSPSLALLTPILPVAGFGATHCSCPSGLRISPPLAPAADTISQGHPHTCLASVACPKFHSHIQVSPAAGTESLKHTQAWAREWDYGESELRKVLIGRYKKTGQTLVIRLRAQPDQWAYKKPAPCMPPPASSPLCFSLLPLPLHIASSTGRVPLTPSNMQDSQVCVLIHCKVPFACTFLIAHQLMWLTRFVSGYYLLMLMGQVLSFCVFVSLSLYS